MNTGSDNPLAGVRVLELTQAVAGPSAGRMLVELGADVIKIEAPSGDMLRFGPRHDGLALYYAQQNYGKRNISLDVSTTEGAEIVRRLAARVDVLLSNARPHALERHGIRWDRLRAVNPRLVFATVSGYGTTGPKSGDLALAAAVEAESGLMMGTARATGRNPISDPMAHLDLYAGYGIVVAILAALLRVARTGVGEHVETTMLQSAFWIDHHYSRRRAGIPLGEEFWGSPSDYPAFVCGDGRSLVIAANACEERYFSALLLAMARPELSDDTRFASPESRLRHLNAYYAVLIEWFATFPDVASARHALEAVNVPSGAVRDLDEAVTSDWADFNRPEREALDSNDVGVQVPAIPIRMSGGLGEPLRFVAERGEHNREVLRELGYDDDAIDALEAAQVVTSRLRSR